MNLAPRKTPKLFLAPMEGVASYHFRKAIAIIGGFDEATCEFLRLPVNAHVPSLSKKYNPDDTHPYPLAAQIMGMHPSSAALMTQELIKRGAQRIDLNCGCPSNTVTGRGAGSSLLKDPKLLYDMITAMVSVATVPISVKMRSGYDDTSLFRENLEAIEKAGTSMVAIHPRTKKEGYSGKANWDYIRYAKEYLSIPVIGNGDILTPEDAHLMLKITQCDALMVGRGALIDPWIFHKIKASFNDPHLKPSWDLFLKFLKTFEQEMPKLKLTSRGVINQYKQLFRYFFSSSQTLMQKKQAMLSHPYQTPQEFLDRNLPHIYNEIYSRV